MTPEMTLLLILLLWKCMNGLMGIVIGVFLLWLVMLPALLYRDFGYWFVLFIKEDEPDNYEYQGMYARPMFKKKKETQ